MFSQQLTWPDNILICFPTKTNQPIPASEGRHRVRHVQVLSYFFICIHIRITHRLSQHLAALSRNSMEQGKRDDGDRGPGGNPVEDDVKGSRLLCWRLSELGCRV